MRRVVTMVAVLSALAGCGSSEDSESNGQSGTPAQGAKALPSGPTLPADAPPTRVSPLKGDVEAFIAAYPAMKSYESLQGYLAQDGNAYNQFMHHDGVATHEDTWVVRPNNDTVYSIAWLNLGAGPIRITLPEADGERYLSLMLIDYDHFQLDTLTHPETPVIVARKGATGLEENVIVIESETDLVLAAVRAELFSDAGDVDNVAALQARMRIDALGSGSLVEPTSPPEVSDAVASGAVAAIAKAGEAFKAKDYFVTREAGASPLVLAAGVYAGQWGMQIEHAFYDGAVVDSENRRLDGAHDYLIEVAAPGIPAEHFWSVTVYDADGRLLPPPDGETARYKLGDKNTVANGDGSLTLRFSSACAGRENCLNTGPGEWNYVLRVYGPSPEMVNGIWTFPKVVRIDA